MRPILALIIVALLTLSQPKPEEKFHTMAVKKITPVMFAETIEPCVKFWVERLGFQKTVEVPEGNKIGFAMMQKGTVELMYQSYASAEKDVGAISEAVRKGPTFLYVEVENLDQIISAVKGAEVVIPERTTFYGAREIAVKDPAGHVITFAQFGAAPQK